jgi:hypothetical protein
MEQAVETYSESARTDGQFFFPSIVYYCMMSFLQPKPKLQIYAAESLQPSEPVQTPIARRGVLNPTKYDMQIDVVIFILIDTTGVLWCFRG